MGQAVAHLSIQAMHEGLFVHQIGGFDAEVLINDFEIPDDQVPISVFTIGYIGDYNELHPNLKELELKNVREKSERLPFLRKIWNEIIVRLISGFFLLILKTMKLKKTFAYSPFYFCFYLCYLVTTTKLAKKTKKIS